MKTLPYISLVATALLLLPHCAVEEEKKPVEIEDDTTAAVKVTNITPYSAHIEGMFGNEDDTTTIAGIHYSLQNTRFISTTGDVAEATYKSRGNYALDLDNLYADTTYYFTTYVKRDGVTYNSDTYKFRTHRLTASTNEVTYLYAYGAQLGLTLSETIDTAKYRGSFGVYYSTRPRVIRESSTLLDKPYQVDGLFSNYDYYCAAFVCQKRANLDDEYIWGETIKFTTPEIGVLTYEPENITTHSAKFSGSVDVRFKDVSEKGFIIFERNRDVTLDSVDTKSDQTILKIAATEESDRGYGDFWTTYSNLKTNKRYYVRAYALVYTRDPKVTTYKSYHGEIFEMRTNSVTMADGDEADMGLSVIWATKNHGAKSAEKIGTMGTPEETIGTQFDGGWRLPTLAEAKELVDSCHWTWGKQNGTYGAIVTQPSGLSIFLPANIATSGAYTLGVYMVNDTIYTRGKKKYIDSYRFVQDIDNEAQCQKTAENRIDVTAEVGIRLVKDK